MNSKESACYKQQQYMISNGTYINQLNHSSHMIRVQHVTLWQIKMRKNLTSIIFIVGYIIGELLLLQLHNAIILGTTHEGI